MNPKPFWLRFGALALGIFILDQLSKLWVLRYIGPGDAMPLIPGCLQFISVQNSGVVFGLFSEGGAWRPLVVLVLPLLLLPVLVWLLLTARQKIERWSYALILGGALGNIADRLRLGHVIDFIDAYLTLGGRERHWYTFNLADSAICIGAALMAISLFRAPTVVDKP